MYKYYIIFIHHLIDFPYFTTLVIIFPILVIMTNHVSLTFCYKMAMGSNVQILSSL
jgi:hypothetical protein